MNASHTNSPWTLQLTFNGIRGAKIAGPKNECIAWLPYWRDDDNLEEETANARLIAAAPELLEAVESLINNNGTGAMELAIKQAQAALAHAKGA